MTRPASITPGLVTLMLVYQVLAGCGGDGKGRRDTAGGDATVADTTAPDTTAPDTAVPDTTAPDTAAPDADVAAACSAADIQACVYASRGVTYIEREGISVTEPVSGRSLPLLARIPNLAGPVPVVIWMHGGAFNDIGHRQSPEWGDVLARHGFLVIHVASARMTADGGRALCAVAAVPEAECAPTDDEDASGLLAVFRVHDLVAVLDDLPRLSEISVNNGGPELDLERVAVGGWSGGARGPSLVMGAKVKPSAGAPPFSLPHSGAAAAFAMSPAGPGFGGFYDDGATTSWDDMRGPFFIATGNNDVKPDKPDLTGPIRRFPFAAQPADGERWLLYSNLAIGVGGHGTYNLGDLSSDDERVRRLSVAIASVTRAFLDAHLRADAAALAWLESDAAAVLAGDVEWLQR